jgi:hypothetical protein
MIIFGCMPDFLFEVMNNATALPRRPIQCVECTKISQDCLFIDSSKNAF